MRRDKKTVLDLLTVIVDLPWLGGIGLPDIKTAYIEKFGQFGEEELYNLYLLSDSGILLRKEADEHHPTTVKMTWAAHELFDELREKLR